MSTRDEVEYFRRRVAEARPLRWTGFRPFKLVFELGAPVCITHPWIAFDGLIAHLLLLDTLGADMFLTPKKRVIDFSTNNRRWFPLKKTGEIYHGSASVFEPNVLRVTKIYKRFEERWSDRLKHKRIRSGQGHFKAYIMSEPYVPAKTVTLGSGGG